VAVDPDTLTPLAFRARVVSPIAGVLELLEVLIGEVNNGGEELSSATAQHEEGHVGGPSGARIARRSR
jgi:hypothetical protein